MNLNIYVCVYVCICCFLRTLLFWFLSNYVYLFLFYLMLLFIYLFDCQEEKDCEFS